MKFGICNEMYVGQPVGEVIEHAAGLGYHGIELAPFALADEVEAMTVAAQRSIAKCAEDNGIEILGLHWLLASPDGLNITAPDAAVRARTLKFFRKLIEIAVNTGGRILTFGSPNQRSFGEGQSRETASARAVDFFSELAPELEAADVTVALEPLEPELTNFITRTSEACDVARAIGSKAIGITLDTHFLRWECAAHGGTYLDAMRRAGPRLAHLHIQDDNSLAPGTGTADFSDYVAAVREIQWAGYVSFEAFGVAEKGRGEELAEQCMAFFRQQFTG